MTSSTTPLIADLVAMTTPALLGLVVFFLLRLLRQFDDFRKAVWTKLNAHDQELARIDERHHLEDRGGVRVPPEFSLPVTRQ